MAKKANPSKRVSKPVQDVGDGSASGILRSKYISQCISSGVDIYQLISQARNETEIIRVLATHTSILSSSVFHLTTLANTAMRFKVKSRYEGRFDFKASNFLKNLVDGLDIRQTEDKGYNHKKGLATLNGTMLQEVITSGGVMAELVLKGILRQPDYVSVIPLESVLFRERKADRIMIPFQEGIELDYPNIFHSALHQHAIVTQPKSMLTPAINSVVNFGEFMEEMQQSIEITGHNRLVVSLDKERIMQFMPEECLNDDLARDKWLEGKRRAVGDALEQLDPQDALVLWKNSQEASILNAGTAKKDYTELLGTLLGILALSLKSNSALLGLRLNSAGQTTSSTESLLSIKTAHSIQKPVEEVWTRIGNLMLALSGFTDLTCEASFDEISLRPEVELASHKIIMQKAILEKLSLGMITDEEAAWELGLSSLPEGYENLSGTHFITNGGDTNIAQQVSNSQDNLGRASAPKDANAGE